MVTDGAGFLVNSVSGIVGEVEGAFDAFEDVEAFRGKSGYHARVRDFRTAG